MYIEDCMKDMHVIAPSSGSHSKDSSIILFVVRTIIFKLFNIRQREDRLYQRFQSSDSNKSCGTEKIAWKLKLFY